MKFFLSKYICYYIHFMYIGWLRIILKYRNHSFEKNDCSIYYRNFSYGEFWIWKKLHYTHIIEKYVILMKILKMDFSVFFKN